MEQKTYDKQTAKFIATICENTPKLTSEVMQAWIQSSLALQRALTTSLDVELVNGDPPLIQVWKELTIGGKTALDLLAELDDKDMFRGDGRALVQEVHDEYTSKGPLPQETFKFVRISVKELGFAKPTTFRRILDRATALGLELCPPMAAPHLRLDYDTQPEDEELIVACIPVKNRGESNRQDMFCLCYDSDNMSLDQALLHDEHLGTRAWKPNVEFVFVLKQ